ncbi:PssE/Cps14G family polysaccharide biosynthesis glycosyltransferase [Clostridium chromiireducens]|uniref:PssE/Cps14G family polysaccharide biosynthesis glycosyltransferase n=1 Tax=Clostridium chromiireducens TaxID=225345 RepID=UPI003AF5F0FB
MIFVTVGSQKFQFNRLLRELDVLVEKNSIKENIFAQTGYSDYKPKNYRFKNFLDRDEFKEIMEMSNKVITHGGTGAIVNAVKQGKKVIAIPRLKEYGEHVDNHQLQIIGEFEKMKFINVVKEIDELENVIENIENHDLKDYISNTDAIIESIDDFIR